MNHLCLIFSSLLNTWRNHKESLEWLDWGGGLFATFPVKSNLAHYIKYIGYGDSYTANEMRAASVMMCISLYRSGVMACILAITALRAPFYSAPALSNVFVRGRHSYTDF